MRATIVLVYVVMAFWLMLAGVARIAIQLSAGQALDPLPFVGGGIGLIALVLLLPAWEDRKAVGRAGRAAGDRQPGGDDPDRLPHVG